MVRLSNNTSHYASVDAVHLMKDIIATGKFCFYTSIFLLFFLFLYLYSALLVNTHDIDIYVESGTSSLLLGGHKSSHIMY